MNKLPETSANLGGLFSHNIGFGIAPCRHVFKTYFYSLIRFHLSGLVDFAHCFDRSWLDWNADDVSLQRTYCSKNKESPMTFDIRLSGWILHGQDSRVRSMTSGWDMYVGVLVIWCVVWECALTTLNRLLLSSKSSLRFSIPLVFFSSFLLMFLPFSWCL